MALAYVFYFLCWIFNFFVTFEYIAVGILFIVCLMKSYIINIYIYDSLAYFSFFGSSFLVYVNFRLHYWWQILSTFVSLNLRIYNYNRAEPCFILESYVFCCVFLLLLLVLIFDDCGMWVNAGGQEDEDFKSCQKGKAIFSCTAWTGAWACTAWTGAWIQV